MKTIKINIAGYSKCSWILLIIHRAFDVYEPSERIDKQWDEIVNGTPYTFNPYHLYVKDKYLFISNKNNICEETDNVLTELENEIGYTMSVYEDHLLSSYESQNC